VRAARASTDASGARVLLTARAECFLVGHPDPLAESVRRLEAYAQAPPARSPRMAASRALVARLSFAELGAIFS
jgi:hypothetical protein